MALSPGGAITEGIPMIENVAENIYTFPIALPNNPLKWLNCYVVRGLNGGRDLLIDSGFNTRKCLMDLKHGMRELGLDPKNTDVFFTHAHSDHTGNAGALYEMGCHLIMGRIDFEYFLQAPWVNQIRRSTKDGMPEYLIKAMDGSSGNTWLVPDSFTPELKEGGDILRYGGYEFECIVTPGHTPGHICLYDKAHRLMFTGDHVLFDITPNITYSGTDMDMLGHYLESLDKIDRYQVDVALPSHRTAGSKGFHERIEELREHHRLRLAEAERIVTEHPDLCGYEIAPLMVWAIHAKSWEDFPNNQKWFATGEALAHLMNLEYTGRIEKYTDANGVERYRKL